jgi:hypothetical protein
MMQRFASASAVAAVVIGLASGAFSMLSTPDPGGRYVLTSVWCAVPLVWGLWAMLTPAGWMPDRLPAWGAVLGGLAGVMVFLVLRLPQRFAGVPLPEWAAWAAVPLAVAVYYLLWTAVGRAYGVLGRPAGHRGGSL